MAGSNPAAGTTNPYEKKYWRFKYRYLKKEKLLRLGVYPDVTLKDAVKKLRDEREVLQSGQDPGQARKHDKRTRVTAAANTFEAVARDWHKAKSAGWTEAHGTKILNSLENNVFAEMGDRPVTELTPPEILAVVRIIERRGSLEIASRVLQRTGSVFRFAIAEGKTITDPTRDLAGALMASQRSHFAHLKQAELPELLQKVAVYDGAPLTRIALQLVLRTFVRTKELRGAQWTEFDADAAQWRIPAQRMKMKEGHIVPLSTQSLALLSEAHAISGHRTWLAMAGCDSNHLRRSEHEH